MYWISKDVILNNNSLKEHYLGWCITGNYYLNDEKVLDNKFIDGIYDVANICAISNPKQNFIKVEDETIVVSYDYNLRIIGKNDKCGVKVEDCYLLLIDYGVLQINIEQKIAEAMGDDFFNEALLDEKKDIQHIFSDDIKILYKQSIDSKKELINSNKFKKIMVGELKVNLEDLEN